MSLNHCNDVSSHFCLCFTLGLILSSRAQQTRYDGKVHLLCKLNEEEHRHYYRQRERDCVCSSSLMCISCAICGSVASSHHLASFVTLIRIKLSLHFSSVSVLDT